MLGYSKIEILCINETMGTKALTEDTAVGYAFTSDPI